MAFKKGQSGNPGGRAKGPQVEKLFKSALLMELKSKGAKMPELRTIARALIDDAKQAGNVAARNCFIERMDGKLPLPLSGPDGEGAVTVIIEHITSGV